VEVDPAWEKAAEEFLHEELEYVVVHNWDEAERGIDLLRADLDGRATFLVHPDAAPDRPEAPPLPEGAVGRLRDRLKLTNGLTDSSLEFLPRLEHCYLA